MLTDGRLYFEGRGWPAAQVHDDAPDTHTEIYTRPAGNKGKRWIATKAEGFWRDLVDINSIPAGAGRGWVLQGFIRRRGDPFEDSESNSGKWLVLMHHLDTLAQGWMPQSEDGISHAYQDGPLRQQAIAWWREKIWPIDGLDLIPEPDGGADIVLRAATLKAFLLASAGSALVRQVSMRHCPHCHSWFEIHRADVRFCSASCRTSFSANKGE